MEKFIKIYLETVRKLLYPLLVTLLILFISYIPLIAMIWCGAALRLCVSGELLWLVLVIFPLFQASANFKRGE